jgi:alpha-L-fucosidase
LVGRDPLLRRLRRHRVPAWWTDAKLGIMVHWTPASVPAFAPVDVEIGDLLRSDRPDALARSPYTEWYENSLRFPDSPVARHHRATYGDRPYQAFAGDWEAGLAHWDPEAWARQFARTGARYVVFVAKHSDGYCLWPTAVANPRRPGWHCGRDVVGEMAEAVRAAGMRFGLYYCGGFDWTFEDRPIGTMADVVAAIPRGDYAAYAAAHVRELIARYRPSVLWGDVAWPGPPQQLWPLFADYYAAVPDGVVNDRWLPWNPVMAAASWGPVRRAIDAGSRRAAARTGGLVPPAPPHYDFRTPEYTHFTEPQPRPWECVRGMDHSFGYNAQSRPEDFVTRDELLWTLVDVVATGGNLLLNVGPRGVDAQIPDAQQARLDWLAEWVVPHREAIAGTRPWVRTGAATTAGAPIRYTARDDTVFAFVGEPAGRVTLTDVGATAATTVETVAGARCRWRETPGGLEVDVAAGRAAEPAVLACTHVAARAANGG